MPSARVTWSVFEVRRLLDALALGPARLLRPGLGGGDPVDGQQAEVAEQRLVVDAAEGGVVDDALRARARAATRRKQSMAAAASPPGVGTQSTSRMIRPWTLVRADGDDDPLGAPRRLAGAFEVQAGVGFGAAGRISPVVLSTRGRRGVP